MDERKSIMLKIPKINIEHIDTHFKRITVEDMITKQVNIDEFITRGEYNTTSDIEKWTALCIFRYDLYIKNKIDYFLEPIEYGIYSWSAFDLQIDDSETHKINATYNINDIGDYIVYSDDIYLSVNKPIEYMETDTMLTKLLTCYALYYDEITDKDDDYIIEKIKQELNYKTLQMVNKEFKQNELVIDKVNNFVLYNGDIQYFLESVYYNTIKDIKPRYINNDVYCVLNVYTMYTHAHYVQIFIEDKSGIGYNLNFIPRNPDLDFTEYFFNVLFNTVLNISPDTMLFYNNTDTYLVNDLLNSDRDNFRKFLVALEKLRSFYPESKFVNSIIELFKPL